LVREWCEFDELEISDSIEVVAATGNLVKIDVYSAGVSFATSLVVAGRYQRKPPLPFVPGTECAGIVREVGDAVSHLSPGDRVCACVDWGAMGESLVTPDATVFKIPDAMPFSTAIGLTNSYMTSLAALTWQHLLATQPGETLLVHGAAGGVGLAAVQIGRILGAKVFATASSAEKLAAAEASGAAVLINYTTEDFRDRVLAETDGIGVDCVLDPVGGDVFDQSLRCIAPEGRIAPVGFASGRIPQIPANILLVKNITACGLNMGYYYGWSPNDMRYHYAGMLREMMDQLCTWYDRGEITPTTSSEFALDDFKQAMAVVLGRKSVGRVSLRIRSE
jgi:NADPH2:quinone reductase